MPNTIVCSSIGVDVAAFCPSVFGRMTLPRDDRMASPSTSDGCGPPSVRSMRFDEVTSGLARGEWPAVASSARSSSTSERAGGDGIGVARQRDLVAAHVHVDAAGARARRGAAGGPAARAAATIATPSRVDALDGARAVGRPCVVARRHQGLLPRAASRAARGRARGTGGLARAPAPVLKMRRKSPSACFGGELRIASADELGEAARGRRRPVRRRSRYSRLRDHEQVQRAPSASDVADTRYAFSGLRDESRRDLALRDAREDRRLAMLAICALRRGSVGSATRSGSPSRRGSPAPEGGVQRPRWAAGPAVEVRSTVSPRRTSSAPAGARHGSSSAARCRPPDRPRARVAARRRVRDDRGR